MKDREMKAGSRVATERNLLFQQSRSQPQTMNHIQQYHNAHHNEPRAFCSEERQNGPDLNEILDCSDQALAYATSEHELFEHVLVEFCGSFFSLEEQYVTRSGFGCFAVRASTSDPCPLEA